MSILGGMTTDYGEDSGSLIMASMITKGIFAINDIDARFNPMDLTLGANGGINMIVGNNSGPNVPDNCISLVDNFKGTTGIYNFEVHGSNAIAFQPSDINSTVYIGDAVIYSDTHNVYLSTFDKALALAVDNLTIDGSLICKDNLKVDGEIYTGEINITKSSATSSNILGYAFKVNQLNSNLELVKYYHDHTNSNLNRAQLVATFGKGNIISDMTQSYNIFEYSSNTSSSNTTGTGTNSGTTSGGESVWSTSGNDIFFGGYGGTQQRVGINTSNPLYPLDVVGVVQAIEFKVGPTLRSMNNISTSRAVGVPIVDFDFNTIESPDLATDQDGFTYGTSYSDPYGNTFTTNGKLHDIKGNGAFTTVVDLLELYMTPNDWSIFTGMGNNFRMYYKINVQYTDKDLNTDPFMQDRFISEFVYPSGGSSNERGFRTYLKTNELFFEGYVRVEDGNSTEQLFSLVFDVSTISQFFGTVHEWELQFSTFEIGTNILNTSAWGIAKILIDGVERVQTFITNTTNFTTQTQQDGAYLYTNNTENPNGYYKILIGPGTTELYEFEMGKLNVDPNENQNTYKNGEDITISERGITGLNTIEVGSDSYSGIYFRDIIVPGEGKYWNGHASNLHGLGQLPLSVFGKDMDVSDFYTGNGTTWFDKTASDILLSSFSNDILNSGDPIFDSCTVLGPFVGNSVSIDTLTVINNTTLKATETESLTVNTDAIVSGSLSVGTSINTTDINVDNLTATSTLISDTVSCTTASVNNLSVNGVLDASNITAYVNSLVSQQVQTQMATISGSLSVANFTATSIESSLIPTSDVIQDLGAPDKRWRDLYLSGNTLYVDDYIFAVEQSDSGQKELRIKGGNVNFGKIKFNEDTIEFDDGTSLASMTQIGSTLAGADGERFGDFTSIRFEVYNYKSKRFVQSISGSFNYPIKHNPMERGNKWRYVDFGNRKVLPIRSDGKGVDKSSNKMSSLKTGGNPKTFSISLLKQNRSVGQNIYVTADDNENINEMYHLRILDPFSVHWQNKCKADFNWYNNQYLHTLGEYVTDKEIYLAKGDEYEDRYVQINELDNFINRDQSNKLYDVEMIYFFKPPLYETKYITDTMLHKYLIPKSPNESLNTVYECITDDVLEINTYQLVEVHTDFGLYPRISLQRWDNSMNTTEFIDVIYETSMGWGAGGVDADSPELSVVFDRFNEIGWIEVLFKMTYNYIMHGVIEGDISDISDDVLNDIQDLTYNDITFVKSGGIYLTDGTILEGTTTICFRKSVFEKYL